MLEKAGLVKPAMEVLERTKREALAWIEDGRNKTALPEKKLPRGPEASIGVDPDLDTLEAQKKPRGPRV
jgi:hypothetical protein